MSNRIPEDIVALESRLRLLHRDLDAGAGFEARVMRRVEAAKAASGQPAADLRAQFERQRAIAARQLRREGWLSGVAVAAIAASGAGLLWQFLPGLLRYSEMHAALLGSAPVGAATLAIAAAIGWGALKLTHTHVVLH